MSHRLHLLPHTGRPVVLVNREQLRVRHGRYFHRRVAALLGAAAGLTPPAVVSWSQGRKVKFPILGNDRVGDCFYAAPLHFFQAVTAAVKGVASTPQFDTAAVIKRYEQLSGGDNGLSDSDVFPEMEHGMVGPNGPYKILDTLLVNPADTAALQMAIWAFTGVMYTASLLNTWLNNTSPGAVWDATGRPDPSAGHAMYLSGVLANGRYEDETWGIDPAIQLTHAGMMASDPEIIVCFCAQQFDPVTRLSPAGLTWEQTRSLWVQYGGKDVGPDPTPSPAPNPSPGPDPGPQPVVLTGTAHVAAQTVSFSVPVGPLGGQRTVTVTIPGQDAAVQVLLPTQAHALPPMPAEMVGKLTPAQWAQLVAQIAAMVAQILAGGGS